MKKVYFNIYGPLFFFTVIIIEIVTKQYNVDKNKFWIVMILGCLFAALATYLFFFQGIFMIIKK